MYLYYTERDPELRLENGRPKVNPKALPGDKSNLPFDLAAGIWRRWEWVQGTRHRHKGDGVRRQVRDRAGNRRFYIKDVNHRCIIKKKKTKRVLTDTPMDT